MRPGGLGRSGSRGIAVTRERYPTTAEITAGCTIAHPEVSRDLPAGGGRQVEGRAAAADADGRSGGAATSWWWPVRTPTRRRSAAPRCCGWPGRLATARERGEDDGSAWHFLLCIDPDGAALNEPWLPGPYTLRGHYEHFFRPCAAEQPEWLPADGAVRTAALPETRAAGRPVGPAAPDAPVLAARHRRRRQLRPAHQGRPRGARADRQVGRRTGHPAGERLVRRLPVAQPRARRLRHAARLRPGRRATAPTPPGRTPSATTGSPPSSRCRCGPATGAADTTPHPDPDHALRTAGAALRRDLPTVARVLRADRPPT